MRGIRLSILFSLSVSRIVFLIRPAYSMLRRQAQSPLWQSIGVTVLHDAITYIIWMALGNPFNSIVSHNQLLTNQGDITITLLKLGSIALSLLASSVVHFQLVVKHYLPDYQFTFNWHQVQPKHSTYLPNRFMNYNRLFRFVKNYLLGINPNEQSSSCINVQSQSIYVMQFIKSIVSIYI